jgi:hypothetical protein
LTVLLLYDCCIVHSTWCYACCYNTCSDALKIASVVLIEDVVLFKVSKGKALIVDNVYVFESMVDLEHWFFGQVFAELLSIVDMA